MSKSAFAGLLMLLGISVIGICVYALAGLAWAGLYLGCVLLVLGGILANAEAD